jgi:hypothetical protein
MSLRKSPTLAAALLAANRQNAKKSTVPRTARGKAWSRLNSLRRGRRSQECTNLMFALLFAPPGRVGEWAEMALKSKPAIHPTFQEIADTAIQAEITVGQVFEAARLRQKMRGNLFLRARSRNVTEKKEFSGIASSECCCGFRSRGPIGKLRAGSKGRRYVETGPRLKLLDPARGFDKNKPAGL